MVVTLTRVSTLITRQPDYGWLKPFTGLVIGVVSARFWCGFCLDLFKYFFSVFLMFIGLHLLLKILLSPSIRTKSLHRKLILYQVYWRII